MLVLKIIFWLCLLLVCYTYVGYGIVLFLVSFIIIKLFNPKKTLGRMFHLGLWLGGSTAICGVFVGGFFGNALEVIYQNFVPGGLDAMPAWMAKFCAGLVVNPVNDPMTVLIIAIVIGCFHLIMGQCMVDCLRRHRRGRRGGQPRPADRRRGMPDLHPGPP